MATDVISGKVGKLQRTATDVLDIRNWKFSPTSDDKPYTSSSTAGYQKTVEGNKKADGSFEFYVNHDTTSGQTAIMTEGEQVTLKLFISSTLFWSVPARINKIDWNCEVETGNPQSASVTFMSHGAWTKPTLV